MEKGDQGKCGNLYVSRGNKYRLSYGGPMIRMENVSQSMKGGRHWTLVFLTGLLLGIFLYSGPVFSQSPGISAREIVVGQSCALKGPARALGIGMRDGALAYFKHINSGGGIRGKKIRLISYDDGYETKACIANTEKLIHQDKAFLLWGYVGTRTSKVAAPMAAAKKVPYFGPYTGAQFLRNPVNPWILNIRASYIQEIEKMVERLVIDKGIKRISVFYPDDAHGKLLLEGVRDVMAKRMMWVLNEANYPHHSVAVEPSVKAMLTTKPEAVIMIGTYEPCAKFIELMRKAGSDALFLNVSFVGGDAMGKMLGNKGLGVVVTQVVPYPYDKRVPVVAEFHRTIRTHAPQVNPCMVSVEGFITAKALCKILLETPDPVTREGFIQTAEKQSNADLGGHTFSFSAGNHQGSNLVYLTQLGPGGFIMPINDLNDLYEYLR
jgi:ABC-type branched-subunit amino acid transport system substrate-binding protein